MTDKSKPDLRVAGLANDGWSNEEEATATCFCGAVQLAFPTSAPGLVTTFVCHCNDCHKLTASMFASNFSILNTHLKHLRGQSNMTVFSQNETTHNNKSMANYFCKTCGTLMYRVGEKFPGISILRIGTVDDFNLMETKLKPRVEQFIGSKAAWVEGVREGEELEERCEGQGRFGRVGKL